MNLLLALDLLLTAFVYVDARRTGRAALPWALGTLLTLVIGLVYLATRKRGGPQRSAASQQYGGGHATTVAATAQTPAPTSPPASPGGYGPGGAAL